VVGLADALAHDMGIGIPGGISLDEVSRAQLNERWKLTADSRAELAAAVAAEIEKAKVFLEIAARR
jgi:hypothetical protein